MKAVVQTIDVVERQASWIDKVKKYGGYLFLVFLVKWIYPLISEIKAISAGYFIKYGIYDPMFKLPVYIAVTLSMAMKVILMKIISMNTKMNELVDKLQAGLLTTTDLYIAYFEIGAILFAVYYLIHGWELPGINKDVSINAFVAWNWNSSMKDRKTLQWSIVIIILAWEAYALYSGQGFILPFDGFIRFGRYAWINTGQVISPKFLMNVTANVTKVTNSTGGV